MLTRAATILVLVGVASGGLTGLARAEPNGPIVVRGDTVAGAIDTTVSTPASPAQSRPTSGSAQPNGDGGVTCTWTEEPPTAQAIWAWFGVGKPGGHWYDVRCSDGGLYLGMYVPPGGGNVPPAVGDAGALARTAVNHLPLPRPQAAHSPAGQGLVGLPTWFWVDAQQWRPLRQRTSAGPVWAEVTATPVSTSWEPGDGSAAITCAGPGTPYDRSRPEQQQSTDCAYTYPRSSAEQPQTGPTVNDRFFTVTVTTTWQVTWTGPAGAGGTLAPLTRTSSFPLAVAQRQTVVTGGSG